jgi:ketosteroid isomerase-like protein
MSWYEENERPDKSAAPIKVWEHACAVLKAGDCRHWADMFAEDGVMEMPLAPPGFPRRIEGREEIRRLMAPVQEKAFTLHPSTRSWLIVHETKDPEVVIAEFESRREEASTGDVYVMPYVHVVRVRDGEIVHLRDYAPFHLAPPSVDQVLGSLGRSTA